MVSKTLFSGLALQEHAGRQGQMMILRKSNESQETSAESSACVRATSPRSCHFSKNCKSLSTFSEAPSAGYEGFK